MNIAITGANRGIGLALAKAYAKKGHRVFALCRRASQGLEELENAKIATGIDVVDRNLKEALAQTFSGEQMDVFINNAGILRSDSLENIDLEDVMAQLEVNTLGPLNMALQMLPHLKSGSKMGVLTSQMGSIGDNASGGYYGYRASKAGANAVCRSLAMDLRPRGIAVAILHPGYVQTEMTGNTGNIGPDEAAEGIVQVMEKLNLEDSGSFWHSDGSMLPW